VRLVLLRVTVLAHPDVAGLVAEHGGEVMVAAATGRGGLAKLAAAHYAAESLTLRAILHSVSWSLERSDA
jgi:hypothetical protein